MNSIVKRYESPFIKNIHKNICFEKYQPHLVKAAEVFELAKIHYKVRPVFSLLQKSVDFRATKTKIL